MSPLSNYCENTNLTPTNTCVLSSKLDILQFKMLFSANTHKKKTNHTNQWLLYTHYYFPKFCLFT